MKIAYLDRDGTINKDYPDGDWANKVIPEILTGAIEGIKLLCDSGYKIIIITNQYIINAGIIKLEQYHEFHDNLYSTFDIGNIEIQDTFFCPHVDSDECNCKKPKTGMIDQSLIKYPDIDIENSIFIGDSASDKELADRVGLKFYGINGNCFDNEYNSIIEIARVVTGRN